MFDKISQFFKTAYAKTSKFLKTAHNKISDFLYRFKYETIMVLMGIIVLFWDMIFKFLLDGKTMTAIKGVFSISSTHNTGGAWSIFANATWVLILFSVLFIIALVIFDIFLKKHKKSYFYAFAMGLLLSGALGNLIDRIKFGYVRDFIKLEFINFPIFNIADIAITVGVILLCVFFIFMLKDNTKAQIETQNNNQEGALNTKENNQEQNESEDELLAKIDKANNAESASEQPIQSETSAKFTKSSKKGKNS